MCFHLKRSLSYLRELVSCKIKTPPSANLPPEAGASANGPDAVPLLWTPRPRPIASPLPLPPLPLPHVPLAARAAEAAAAPSLACSFSLSRASLSSRSFAFARTILGLNFDGFATPVPLVPEPEAEPFVLDVVGGRRTGVGAGVSVGWGAGDVFGSFRSSFCSLTGVVAAVGSASAILLSAIVD
jgi:hypothetical protein